MTRPIALLTAALALCVPSAALAQPPAGPAGAVDVSAGYAAFVDDAAIGHSTIGASARVYLTSWLSAGPEVQYMKGPRFDRDVFLLGNVTIDFLGSRGRGARVIPFTVVGGGLMRHSDRFGQTTFTSSEGAFTGGGGVRVLVSERVVVGAEARCGWEPHCRIAGKFGVTFGG